MGDGGYDVFISYSSADRKWVEALAELLRDDGLEVWLDAWRIRAGDNFIDTLQEGLSSARAGLLVVTAEALASGWVNDEFGVMQRRAQRSRRRFSPHPDPRRPSR